MKNLKTIAVALVAIGALSVSAQNKKIDVSKSKIEWTGKKVTGQHTGTVKFQDGVLAFKAGKLSGGSFTVDMNSISDTDLQAGQGKEKLEGHLKADDFFGVEKYPVATIVFKTIAAKSKNLYAVTADLTIKGQTNPVAFDLNAGPASATAKFNIDRIKYGIRYGSGSFFQDLGDKTIDDNFLVSVTLAY
jgi:polyisoprenoid-binding protein YceI